MKHRTKPSQQTSKRSELNTSTILRSAPPFHNHRNASKKCTNDKTRTFPQLGNYLAKSSHPQKRDYRLTSRSPLTFLEWKPRLLRYDTLALKQNTNLPLTTTSIAGHSSKATSQTHLSRTPSMTWRLPLSVASPFTSQDHPANRGQLRGNNKAYLIHEQTSTPKQLTESLPPNHSLLLWKTPRPSPPTRKAKRSWTLNTN